MDIPIALSAIEREVRNSRMVAAATNLRTEIESGSAAWRALERADLLPRRHLLLVRVGEQAGRLSENLVIVADQQAKERQYRSQMSTALMYPALVLGLTIVVGLVVAWFVLPRLATVFSGIKLELPFITRVVIAIGLFLQKYGAFAVPLILAFLGALVYFLFFYRRTKYIGQAMLFAFPPTRRVMRESELARLGYLLGTLLEAGISVTEAMVSLHDSTDLRPYQKFYRFAREALDSGDSFEKMFTRYKGLEKILPIATQLIIVSAERSGRLSETMRRVGQGFERKMENSAKGLATLLEPILLVIVWLGVALVAFAVILPIYGLIGGLH